MQEMEEMKVPSLGREDSPGGGNWLPTPVFLPGEAHRQREPGRLQSVGSQGVGHDWAHTRESVCLKSSFSLETSQGNHVFSADCQPATFNLPGFPWWAQLVKNPPAIRETWVRPLGLEDPLEKGTGYPLQYSGLKNSMHCIFHGLAKSRTRLSNFHTTIFKDKSTTHEIVFSDFTRETNPPDKTDIRGLPWSSSD